MVLSDKEISTAMKRGELRIFPPGFRLSPAGVDLRVDRRIRLKPKQHSLGASIERVELSGRIVGFLHLRSSLTREVLFASLALVYPGFLWQLYVIYNYSGTSSVMLPNGVRLIQRSMLRVVNLAHIHY